MPINVLGSFDLAPAPVAYTKPLVVLVDEFTTSSGDMLAAIFQDNHRGPLLGMRTNGAGAARGTAQAKITRNVGAAGRADNQMLQTSGEIKRRH